MIIKNVSCGQFAGIRDKNISLSEGLNILLGANETGKSTLVDLIYRLLFQDVKVRKNSDFQNLYFPRTTAAVQADFIDGKLVFDTSEGTYTLEKEWQTSSGTCKLRLPDGTMIRDGEQINSVLSRALIYGQGVYDEMVFASQKRVMTVLPALFQAKKAEVRDELAATVKKAVMETGGISVDKLQSRLEEILAGYAERWDFEADMPEGGRKRGVDNKWSCAISQNTEQAKILRAWYAKEEIASAWRKAEDAECSVDRANRNLAAAKEKRAEAAAENERFGKLRATLEGGEKIRVLYGKAVGEKNELDSAAIEWPRAMEYKAEAEALRTERNRTSCKKMYETVVALREKLARADETLRQLGEVSAEDVKQAEALKREIESFEARLRGLNITAHIRRLGETEPIVRAVGSGEELDISAGSFTITEAVDIVVPGVMEMRLAPDGVDVSAVGRDLTEKRGELSEILARYNVKNVTELRQKQSAANDVKKSAEALRRDIERELNGGDEKLLRAEYAQLPENVPAIEAVEEKIRALCGRESLESFIGRQTGKLDQFETNYGTRDMLTERIQCLKEEIDKYYNELNQLESVPEEYRDITDVDAYAKQLRASLEACDKEIDSCRDALADAGRELGERTAEEYADELETASRVFEEQKQKYAHWKHIRDVVNRVKSLSDGDPMRDVEEHFREYLALLSDGHIALESLDEQMTGRFTSGCNRLTYENLSEGTKDTVALAFRLAMLRHLYPDGGGLAVFDDPFTDMDPARTEQACRLLREFAKNNQVIFVTCDEKYTTLLSGAVVTEV